MTHALSNNETEAGLERTLKLINVHLPDEEYKSKYLFLKTFQPAESVEYYYCLPCEEIFKFNDYEKSKECPSCTKKYNKIELKEKSQFFVYIPLKNQLKELVESELYTECIRDSHDSDVINGDCYKELRRNGTIGNNDITIQWNTDGVQLFKSSNYSLWGIQVSINELPYRSRKNNMLLCAVWCNNNKPPMNMFLQPFTDELCELEQGFEVTPFGKEEIEIIKVHNLFASVDSVARPLIQNVHQYNGTFGCSYCLHKGERITVNRGYARVYCGDVKRLRNMEEHIEFAEEAYRTNNVVKGVKGNSVMMLLLRCDIINDFPPDYMHAVCLGVAHLFIKSWFNSTYSDKSWYLGPNKKKIFVDKLLSIKPPCEITRTPQTVDAKLKANEYKTMTLYYTLNCLKDIMPKRYYQHWFLFVFTLHMFLQMKITEEDFQLAQSAVKEFVLNVEPLYGKEFMKFNVHLLLHLPKFVKLYGSLWAWSAFPFEHFNGVLKNLFHGTQGVTQQIVKTYFRLRTVKYNSTIFADPNCSERARKTFVSLMKSIKVKNCIEFGDHLRIFGNEKYVKLTIVEEMVIKELLGYKIDNKAVSYCRFIYDHVLYHSESYKLLKKRNNSCIITKDGLILSITDLIRVKALENNESIYVILGKQIIKQNQPFFKYLQYSSKFCHLAKRSEVIVSCKLEDVYRKCIVVQDSDDNICVYPLCNKVETD